MVITFPNTVDQFDATLKKKKKKSGKKVEFDGDVVAGGSDGDAAEGGEKADAGDDISFGDLKKRKKKKSALKKADGDEEGGDGTATAVDEVESSMEQMFIDLKKKKKKKSSSSALGESTTAGDADDVGDVAMTGTSQDELGEGAAAAADENMVTSLTLEEEGKESWLESDRDYTYHEVG